LLDGGTDDGERAEERGGGERSDERRAPLRRAYEEVTPEDLEGGGERGHEEHAARPEEAVAVPAVLREEQHRRADAEHGGEHVERATADQHQEARRRREEQRQARADAVRSLPEDAEAVLERDGE